MGVESRVIRPYMVIICLDSDGEVYRDKTRPKTCRNPNPPLQRLPLPWREPSSSSGGVSCAASLDLHRLPPQVQVRILILILILLRALPPLG